MSNTRFPLYVCCKLSESAARAVGPKELDCDHRDHCLIRTHRPLACKCPQIAAIRHPRSGSPVSHDAPYFLHIFNFWFFCSNCSVWLFILSDVFPLGPYCKISSSPYRLSRTTVLRTVSTSPFAFVLYLFCFCFHIHYLFKSSSLLYS